MSLTSDDIRKIIKNFLAVTKKLVVILLSWLLDLLGYAVYNKNESHIQQGESQLKNDMTQEELKETILAYVRNEITSLKNEVQAIRKKEEFNEQNSFELGDKLNMLEAQLKELQREQVKESSEGNRRPEEAQIQQLDVDIKSNKLYFEPSSDGRFLVNVSTTESISSNFIELETSTGMFSILQSPRYIEYILANKDYSLAACEVHIMSKAPTSINVDEPGLAQKIGNSDDWSVIKKAKITLS